MFKETPRGSLPQRESHLYIRGCEEAAINAADALLQAGVEHEHRLLLLIKAIDLHAASVPPNGNVIDAILAEVNG